MRHCDSCPSPAPHLPRSHCWSPPTPPGHLCTWIPTPPGRKLSPLAGVRRSCFPGCPGLGRTLLDPCGALYGQTPQLRSQANPWPGRRCPCCVTTGKSLHLPVVGKQNGSGPAGRNSVSPVWSRGQRLARSKCAGDTTRHRHQLLPPSTQQGTAIIISAACMGALCSAFYKCLP